MARIRTIKPEFWADEKLGPLSPMTRLVFLGLVSQADDAGRLVDSVRMIDGALFPHTEDSCREALRELAEIGVIIRGVTESGQRIIEISGWSKHQKVDKPSKGILPPIAPSPGATSERVARESRESRESLDPSRARATTFDPRPTTYDQDRGPNARERANDPPKPPAPVALVPDDDPDDPMPWTPAPSGRIPFADLEWSGRTSGSAVLHEWAILQPVAPSNRDRTRYRQVCKRLADEHTVEQIALAFLGMNLIWPHAPPPVGKNEPWTPDDLDRRFAKALPAARDHPVFREQRFRDALDNASNGGGW